MRDPCDLCGRDHSMRDLFLIGTCDLCGQDLILIDDDCWHPWYVLKACPPESPGRPGREHWREVAAVT